jgi:hypothetical protein
MDAPVLTTLTITLIAIGVIILLFFALRSLMLWYWKIDTVIKIQEEQKIALWQIRDAIMKGKNFDLINNDSPEEIERKAKLYDQTK